MCGFRASAGGAQKKFHMVPDMTCLGKIIGGGMPMAAFGGKREIMSCIAPMGPVYQAGTLSGNPIAMTSGFATLSVLQRNPQIFRIAEEQTEALCQAIEGLAAKIGVPVQVQRVGSMFTVFFTDHPVRNYEDAANTNDEAFKIWFHTNLEQGIYYAASRFESNFLSYKHGEKELTLTLEAAEKALSAVKEACYQ